MYPQQTHVYIQNAPYNTCEYTYININIYTCIMKIQEDELKHPIMHFVDISGQT